MISIKNIEWALNYRAFIGPLSDREAETWKAVIRENIEKPTAHEVNSAVAQLCVFWSARPSDSKARKPGLAEIMEAIKRVRAPIDQAFRDVSPWVEYNADGGGIAVCHINVLRGKLLHCDDPDEAWDIICSPRNVDHQRALQAYAVANRINFKRFVPPGAYRDFHENNKGKRYGAGIELRQGIHAVAAGSASGGRG